MSNKQIAELARLTPEEVYGQEHTDIMPRCFCTVCHEVEVMNEGESVPVAMLVNSL